MKKRSIGGPFREVDLNRFTVAGGWVRGPATRSAARATTAPDPASPGPVVRGLHPTPPGHASGATQSRLLAWTRCTATDCCTVHEPNCVANASAAQFLTPWPPRCRDSGSRSTPPQPIPSMRDRSPPEPATHPPPPIPRPATLWPALES
jgi:hypothetical protein